MLLGDFREPILELIALDEQLLGREALLRLPARRALIYGVLTGYSRGTHSVGGGGAAGCRAGTPQRFALRVCAVRAQRRLCAAVSTA